ncbi:hypothetical protein A3Q56_08464 [Intoshia linei]|uniref:DDE-1 domain-containing protein n=1 Tax=Intoshia linei TaxID=1819745 RepID=A0A177APU2_9BILA|nr:hypothetical protein A3Q56_08464 [Intoshia linei]
MDQCPAHPPIQFLMSDNVVVLYTPPNTTSLIKPQDQGIIRAFKCRYNQNFIKSLVA